MPIKKMMQILAAVNVLALLAVLFATPQLLSSQAELDRLQVQRYESYLLADELRQSSADLTRMVRTYVGTGDERYMEQYYAVLDIRDGKIPRPRAYHRAYWDYVAAGIEEPRAAGETVAFVELMRRAGFPEEEMQLLEESKRLSDALVKTEERAMNAMLGLYQDDTKQYVRKGKVDTVLANRLLLSDQYHQDRAAIVEPIDQLLITMEQRFDTLLTAAQERVEWLELLLTLCIFSLLASVALTIGMVFKRIINPINEMTVALARVAEGQLDTPIPAQKRLDEIGNMANAAQVFKQSMLSTVEKNWVKTQVADIAKAMQQENDLASAARYILNQLVPLLEGGQGAFYAYYQEDQQLPQIATYAYSNHQGRRTSFALGEGLVGQAGLEKKTIVVDNVPEDYSEIQSSLGSALPSRIIAAPLVLQDRLIGVLEIAAFKEFSAAQQEIIDELLPLITLYADTLIRSQHTEKLLLVTRKQAEELKFSEANLKLQQEEMRTVNEELRTQSSELEERTNALAASEEELRCTNEQLKEQAAELEEKIIEQ